MGNKTFRNASGDQGCDEYLVEELRLAGIDFSKDESLRAERAVPSSLTGYLHGWEFVRNWYYWEANSAKWKMPFTLASRLYALHGKDVRVDGNCSCPEPPYPDSMKPWKGVRRYHVDAQDGLIALADAIREYAEATDTGFIKGRI